MASASSQSRDGSRIESLADKIYEIMQEGVFDAKSDDFAPHDAIDRLISIRNRVPIMKVLGLSMHQPDPPIVDQYILTKAKRLFANSIHSCDLKGQDLLEVMETFEKNDFSDASLPIPAKTLAT